MNPSLQCLLGGSKRCVRDCVDFIRPLSPLTIWIVWCFSKAGIVVRWPGASSCSSSSIGGSVRQHRRITIGPVRQDAIVRGQREQGKRQCGDENLQIEGDPPSDLVAAGVVIGLQREQDGGRYRQTGRQYGGDQLEQDERFVAHADAIAGRYHRYLDDAQDAEDAEQGASADRQQSAHEHDGW